MRGELIRERLHNGRRVYGTHVCSLTNPLAARMQAGIEYDYIFICNEHMPIDRTETAMMCQFYAAHGISPIVRVPRPQAQWATMALDAGAQGIVAPYVETVEEVTEMVGAVKYRPIKGRMLREILSGERIPADKTVEFLNRFNRDNYLIVGVESVAAYENLDVLLAVKGVDGIFVGPHDMTVSMEVPEEYENPRFRKVVSDICRRCRAAGVGFGIHYGQTTAPDEWFTELMEEGMNWILYGSDIGLIRSEMQARLDAFRREMGDAYVADAKADARPSSCLGKMDRKEE